MPTIYRFAMLILVLAAVTSAWADDAPLAGGHADAPSGDQPATDQKAKPPAKKKADDKKDSRGKKDAASDADKLPDASAKAADASRLPAAAARKKSEAEQEEAALTLVREQHPALVELLERLKATKPADYRQAIKELYRDSQRLAAVRQRDAERYTLELRAWQLDSRIRLLTAKLSLEDRAELEEELKAGLTQRAELRLALKKLERDRAAARVKKLDEDIEKLTAAQEAEVNRSLGHLLRAAQKASGARRQKEKKTPAETPRADAAGAR